MSKGTGGPAFPTGEQLSQNNATGETTVHQYLSDGMSLRDYFAAKAMPIMWNAGFEDESTNILLAEGAYQLADAMLAAREK